MTMKRPARHALLTAGITLMLAACSGGSTAVTSAPTALAGASAVAADSVAPAGTVAPTTGAGGSADSSCTIVTKDAVAAAAGFPIATASGAAGICYFQNTDKSKYLVVWQYATQDAMASVLQIEAGSEHIDGLGDDAFWSGAGGILFVRKGDHGLELQDPDFVFSPASDPTNRDLMVTLARTALAGL